MHVHFEQLSVCSVWSCDVFPAACVSLLSPSRVHRKELFTVDIDVASITASVVEGHLIGLVIAGLVDDEQGNLALVMQYYKNGTLYDYMMKHDTRVHYLELNIIDKVKLAFMVSGVRIAPTECTNQPLECALRLFWYMRRMLRARMTVPS